MAIQNHTYHLSTQEFKRYQRQWYLTLNKSSKNAGTERVLCGPEREKEMSQRDDGRIHDRFLRDQVYRASQLKIGWTEEKCIDMDKLAQENHSYRLSREEY